MSHPESFSPLLTYANPLLISDHWEARVEMLIAQILKLQTSLFLVLYHPKEIFMVYKLRCAWNMAF